MTTSPVAWRKPVAQGRSLALVDVVKDDANVALLPLDFLEDVAGAVGAAIVDEDDLLGDRHLLDAADDLADPLLFVVDGNDDGELEALGNGINAELPAGHVAQELLEQAHALRRVGERVRRADGPPLKGYGGGPRVS